MCTGVSREQPLRRNMENVGLVGQVGPSNHRADLISSLPFRWGAWSKDCLSQEFSIGWKWLDPVPHLAPPRAGIINLKAEVQENKKTIHRMIENICKRYI